MQFRTFADKNNAGLSSILQRIADDDRSAVTDCIDRYGKLIWSLARRFNNTREDAEDAVQEILIDIWRYSAQFDEAKSPEGAFVTLIAKRRLIDRLRRSKTRLQTSFVEGVLENRAGDADKKLQKYVEMKYAVDALDKLLAHEKQILQLAIYDGMSHSEIAESTGLPLGTVKSQLRRGYQKLRILVGHQVSTNSEHLESF